MAEEDDKHILEAASKLPLSEQAQHKDWKVRTQAFETIEKTCSTAVGADDPALADLGGIFVKAVSDTNAAALDKVLDALQAYLQKTDEKQAARLAEPACKNMASKQLKQRPGTVKRVGEALALFTELEQADAVLNGLFPAFSDKVPKVVVTAVEMVLQLVSAFGTKVIPAKQVLGAMPALFDAKQKPIRDAAKNLTVELAGWVGVDTVKTLVCGKMPEALRKEVEKQLDEQAGAPRKAPERMTRKQQAMRQPPIDDPAADPNAPAAGGPTAAAAAAEPEEEAEGLDAYELAEPVDVVKQLDKAFWEGLASAKWTERRNALQRLRAITANPRLATGDLANVLRELKKIVGKDSNVVCVAESIACVGNMAQGLRTSFAAAARVWAGLLLDKLKDKNLAATANSISALTTFFKHCIALQDVAEDLGMALDHKTAKVKLETLKILQATVEAGNKQAAAKAIPAVLPAVAKAANDAGTDIREAALCVLVAFCFKAGATLPPKIHDQLDDIRKKRFVELLQQAQAQGAAPKPAPSSASGAASAGSAAAPSVLSNTDASTRPLTARSGAATKRTAAPSRTASGAKAAAASSFAPAGPADDDDAGLASGTLSKDEAEAALMRLFGEEAVTNLKSEQWKFRKEAMEEILGKIEAFQGSEADSHAGECIQGFSHLPGWSEKNFQVYGKVFEAIIALVSRTSALVKRPGFVVIGGLVDKLSDSKLKGLAFDTLTALSEAISPQFVCTQLHKKAAAHKSPKVLSEGLAWMTRTMEEFTLVAFDVSVLLSWAKADLASTQAPVRNAAVQLLATCHKQLGPGLAPLVQSDLKPAQWTILEDAFAKNPQQQVAATRHARRGGKAAGSKASAAAPGVAEESSVSTIASAEDLLPRADISGAITATIMTNLNGEKWKDRNEAMTLLVGVLEGAGGRIQPSLHPELLSTLKARLADSNRNLAARVLLFTADMARAMGPTFDRLGKQLLLASVPLIHESKKQAKQRLLSFSLQ